MDELERQATLAFGYKKALLKIRKILNEEHKIYEESGDWYDAEFADITQNLVDIIDDQIREMEAECK
jgi:hypothetical protein